ncbi:MAG: Rrf2 family transcriptional regulator [Candidatus Riflebacteria bacterium HGW-Riflebacteria-1]|nr:MAG: Rrf2 family transcriptional regulator [Candidatus Riflebacteria bacterium HGW-Riflebacteria-1]
MFMKISTRSRYGLRIMVELAQNAGKGLISAETIAKKQEISEKYIHLLVGPLISAGLVRAVRGAQGGYEIARSSDNISALDVIAAIEGKTEPAPCLGQKFTCSRETDCATQDLWKTLASAVDNVLADCTLTSLMYRHRSKQEAAITYQI